MEDIAALIRDLSHTDREVRYTAANTLGEMGPAAQAAIPAMIQAKLLSDKAGDSGPYARALAWIGPAVIPTVRDLIESDAASRVAYGLQVMGPAETPISDGEQEGGQAQPRRWKSPVWYSLMHILWMIGEPAVPSLIGLMGNPNPDVQAFATQIVSHLCDDDGRIIEAARPALVKALSDSHSEVWKPAALTLARRLLEPQMVVPALVRLRDEMEAEKTPEGEYPDVEMLDWVKDTLLAYEMSAADNKSDSPGL
jgi:hypothetical protein